MSFSNSGITLQSLQSSCPRLPRNNGMFLGPFMVGCSFHKRSFHGSCEGNYGEQISICLCAQKQYTHPRSLCHHLQIRHNWILRLLIWSCSESTACQSKEARWNLISPHEILRPLTTLGLTRPSWPAGGSTASCEVSGAMQTHDSSTWMGSLSKLMGWCCWRFCRWCVCCSFILWTSLFNSSLNFFFWSLGCLVHRKSYGWKFMHV